MIAGIAITITSAHAAPLLPGKKIGVDYGPTLTANWNNFTANGSKSAGTVVHLDGTVSDLLAMTVSNGQFFNNDGTNNWVGLQANPTSITPNPKAPLEFVDSVTTDIAGNYSLGDGTPFRLVVTGLNPYLTYKVDAVSSAATGSNTESMTILGDATYGPTAISRPLTVTQGLFHSFASVIPTTGGQLTFNSIDSGPGTNPIVNGILIEALAPTAAGLLDNDGDTMPNWWEVAYQFDPESNLDGGSADFDEDGVSNVDEFLSGSDPRDPLSTPPTLWAVDGDGSWNTPGNWSTGSVPNSQDRNVKLPATALVTATGATIALDIPVTLGRLEVTGGKPFTLGAANPLTFSMAGPEAFISTAADAGNSLKILGDVVLASPLEVTTGGTSAITIGGSLTETTGPHAITKAGTGDLVLSGDASGFAGDMALNAGRLVLNRPGAFTFDNLLSGAGSLVHAGGGTLSMSLGNTHTGGTRVTNAGTLSLDSAAPLGSGALTLDNGTLHATADVQAGTRSLNVGTGGATVDVDDGFLLTTGGSAASSGTVTKNGPGTWRFLQGGNAGTVGLLTVSAGTLDLNRNDTWGNHAASTQALTIQSGGLVTNGTAVTSGYNTVQTLTLDGGELRVSGTARALVDGDLFRFEAYGIRHSIAVTGTAPASITNPGALANAGINIGDVINLGGGVGADLTVNVADVTASSATDLTVSAVLKNNYTASYALLANGLVKTGDGTLELTALNRYTGNTSVEAGTLILGQAFLADTADVKLTAGATLQLDLAGTDTIAKLFIDGVQQVAGLWGRPGHPTAEHTTSLIAGDGLLEVTTEPPASYAGWARLFTGFTVTNPDLDFDDDGLASGVEWIVDGDPTANDTAAAAPTFDNTTNPDDFLFIFRRRDDAATDPGTTIVVEYGSDLGGWTPAEADWITVDDNGFGTSAIDGVGVDKVTVAIPRTLAVGGKLFARLRVTVVTP